MEKQKVLPLDAEEQEQRRRVWKHIPEESRMELVALQARLIAHAVRGPRNSQEQESAHEVNGRLGR